jgi:butyryl-CoA dehydrogenase
MWISNGDHELSENIVHLVLAKIPDAQGRLIPGTRGISLFIVPKKLVDEHGTLTGERNDVAVAGLNHKLGYRGLPNALLNFGEGRYPARGAAGAIGYRVGAPGAGLKCMFHMMNEARIAVGIGAAAIGYAGFEASLAYAKERRQGRPMGFEGKDPNLPPVRIIEHADVRRMLLAQKAYAEGGLALTLYCARLIDEARTGSESQAREASVLLELLTPVAKSWPSEWGLEANSLAIQILGGYGYTRDFPVEQLWRDNRLNMIHEGTHGIQALDLLGRKVRMDNGEAFELLTRRVAHTVAQSATSPTLESFGRQLDTAFADLKRASVAAWQTGDPQDALANATPFLQAFGHATVAWLWLDIAITVRRAAARQPGGEAADGRQAKLQTMRYFFEYELPKIDAWLGVVANRTATCRDMREEWFDQ